jgi:dynein heavy chain
LGVLVEQLKSPSAMQIFDILHEAGSPIRDGFSSFLEDLLKLYVQARDNVQFLFTILKHLEVIVDFK